MTVYSILRPATVVLALAIASPAVAQSGGYGSSQSGASVTSADIQRLQDQVYDTGNEVSRLRSRDQSLADRLSLQLDDLRDEVVYLKVKMRKEGSVTRSDYNDVRSRVESVRSEARGEASRQGPGAWSSNSGSGSGSSSGYGTGTSGSSGSSGSSGTYGGTTDQQSRPNAPAKRNEVPAGQEIDVRLEKELSSNTAQVEDRFTATTMVDLYQGETVLIPAGSTLRGVVSSVNKATRTDRKGSMTIAFDQISVQGRSYPIRATVTQAIESEGVRGEVGKIGAGAGVGAIIGGILGGFKGAMAGILIGGGGTVAATEGKDVELPAGTILRVRLDSGLNLR